MGLKARERTLLFLHPSSDLCTGSRLMNALQHKAEYILTVTNELVQNLSIYFVQNLGEE